MRQHEYEAGQDFNLITRTLHATRYRHLNRVAQYVRSRIGDRPMRIVDIGAGTGRAYDVLKAYSVDYTAIELDEDFVQFLGSRYGDQPGWRLLAGSVTDHFAAFENADLIIALESLEHIPEALVVRVVEAVAEARPLAFYATVPNEVGPALLIKNAGSFLMGWSRWKEYGWADTWAATFDELDKMPPHGTGHKGFDWRWLAQTIRHNMQIDRTLTNPSDVVPRWLSPNIGFVCSPR